MPKVVDNGKRCAQESNREHKRGHIGTLLQRRSVRFGAVFSGFSVACAYLFGFTAT